MNQQRRRVLSSGYIALDLISYQEHIAHRAGGTATNVAANLAFFGWEASIAGLIGGDEAGRIMIRDLKRSKVDTAAIEARSDVSTPLVLHEILGNGHRFRFSCRLCGRRFPKYRPLTRETVSALCEKLVVPNVFFFDRANAAAADLAEFLRERGTLIVFEPSTKGREAERCIKAAHVVKYSYDRSAVVAPLLESASPELQLVTKGALGIKCWLGGKDFEVPGFPTTVIDSAGAGDWTTAGFLWALPSLDPKRWKKSVVIEALRLAQALAAVSCGFPGARAVSEHLTRDQMVSSARALIEKHVPVTRAVGLRKGPPATQGMCPECLKLS